MKTGLLKAQVRSGVGKQITKRLIRKGLVPGILYGAQEEIKFSASLQALKSFVYTPDFVLININVDGKEYPCIVKELQFHKVTDQLIHIDLLQLVEGKKLKAEIPIKLIGNAVGVKEGGRLVFKMKSLKVLTTPDKLRECIEVDVSNINIGDNIRVQDIEMDGMRILNSPRVPVVGVITTRVLKQEAAAGGTKEVDKEEEAQPVSG